MNRLEKSDSRGVFIPFCRRFLSSFFFYRRESNELKFRYSTTAFSVDR